MRVVWSRRAIADLVGIRQYIEQDNPKAARRVAERIVRAAERLAKHPHLGRPGREPETRELIVGGSPYIICYEVREGFLAILAVLHAARERADSEF